MIETKSLITNACGVCGCRYVFHGTLLDTEERDWDQSFDINVKSMFHTSKTCVRMVRGGTRSCEWKMEMCICVSLFSVERKGCPG